MKVTMNPFYTPELHMCRRQCISLKKKVITISYIRKTCLFHVPKLCHQVFSTQYFSARFGKKRHLLPLKPAFHKEKTCRQESRAKLRTPTFPTLLTSDQEESGLCFTLSQGLKPCWKNKCFLLVLRYRGYQQGLQSAPCDVSPKTFRLTQSFPWSLFCSHLPDRQPPMLFHALPGEMSHQHVAGAPAPPCRVHAQLLLVTIMLTSSFHFQKKGKRPKPQLEQTYEDPLHLPKPQG